MGRFSYKIHEQGGERLLAVSDTSLLGKSLKDNDFVFHISEDFYKQDTCDESEIKELIKTATIINVVGEGIVSFMINEKVIESNKVIKISGVPHAQIVSVQ